MLQRLHYMSRISHCHRVVGDIFHHHAPCSDHTAVAYFHARTYHHTGSQPAIVAYSYRQTTLLRLTTFKVIDRVIRGHELHVRAYFRMFANRDESTVEHRCTIVDEHLFADSESMTVVAVEWGINARRLGYARYQFLDNCAILGVGQRHALHTCAQPVCMVDTCKHLSIVESIELAAPRIFSNSVISHFQFMLYLVSLYKCICLPI